jgi:hypothetical protein
VVRDPAAPWVAHVATVQLAAAVQPEPVLAQDRLAGLEPLTDDGPARRRRARHQRRLLPAVRRPVHLHANDGQLVQTPTVLGRAFG